MENQKNINYKTVKLSQYYFTEKGNLKGIEQGTGNVITINQTDKISDAFSVLIMDIVDGEPKKDQIKNEFKDKYNYVIGKFKKFDKETCILISEIGFKIHLLDIEKSKFLKERTKKILNSLTY